MDHTPPEWRTRLLQSRLPWAAGQPIRPADVSEGLCDAMLARDAQLEDVNYLKVVPNRFIVELNEDNYARNFGPIRKQVVRQWSARLMECLNNTNSRQGRKTFYFGGPVRIDVRPAGDLQPGQARILARIQPDETNPYAQRPPGKACLELAGREQRWDLSTGEIFVIGRREGCQVRLEDPLVQEKRLVSGQHAYLQAKDGVYRLFDGSPEGKPSVNGAFVNGLRIGAEGRILEHGDTIILASLDPNHPRSDTPGVAVLRFWLSCP